ncbi:alpha/beta hydrolase [Algoriphagus terrigena]|uniref:alpha/beta hydrolase n=1 Tax=Algoriphagus terrigena TaxID=344884 RepID=UPI0003FD7ADC|nr:alpha/beta hydrolase [Algoriphagus terrigena]
MKSYFGTLLIFLFLSTSCDAQEKTVGKPPGILDAPVNWGKETISLPPTFASSIKFNGVEEVRFAPGWDDISNAEFWTYSFVWYFDGQAEMTEKRLEELMTDYFTGLTAEVGKNNGIALEKITKSVASFSSKNKSSNQRFYEGSIDLFDVFFTQKQIRLHVKVKEFYCPDLDKHLMVFSFSPKSFNDKVWNIFRDVSTPEDCSQLEETFENSFTSHKTDDYELIIPKRKSNGVLVLFPGFPENPDIIKREFEILEPAVENGITVALMTFNRRIWLEDHEKKKLFGVLAGMFAKYNLETGNVFIGGFSSGGNVSLLMGNYLKQSQSQIQPIGVFAIDSPVDLLGLYENAKRNINRNFSAASVQESQMLIDLLESGIGKPESGLANFEEKSVYTKRTNNAHNLSELEDVKIRLYTEPDTVWWKENRMNDYEDMNAYFLKDLSEDLSKKFGNKVEFIPTENKGYRSNGQRHPHSWSIVDVDDLIKWIADK